MKFIYCLAGHTLTIRSEHPTHDIAEGNILEEICKIISHIPNSTFEYTPFIDQNLGYVGFQPKCHSLDSENAPICEMLIIQNHAPHLIKLIEGELVALAKETHTPLEKTSPEAFNCFVFDKVAFSKDFPEESVNLSKKQPVKKYLRQVNPVLFQFKYAQTNCSTSPVHLPGFKVQ